MDLRLFTVSVIASFLFTWAARYYSIRKNIVDLPNERSSHDRPTPRGGGISIILVWFSGLIYLYFTEEIRPDLFLALSSGLFLSVISILDDLYDIKPILRIIVQFASSALALFALGGVNINHDFGNFSPLFSVVTFFIALTGIVWFINLFNFLDGIDAYASIEAITISIAFLLLTDVTLPLLLIAAVLGFLIWNWPKAKIFMGDVGSTQLGFIIAVLAIYQHNEKSLPLIWSGILTAPFWFDATLTLFRRFRNREKLSQAHRKHAYQRLVQSGLSHLQVDLLLISINIFIILMVYIASPFNWLQLPLLGFVIILLYACTKVIDKRKPFPKD